LWHIFLDGELAFVGACSELIPNFLFLLIVQSFAVIKKQARPVHFRFGKDVLFGAIRWLVVLRLVYCLDAGYIGPQICSTLYNLLFMGVLEMGRRLIFEFRNDKSGECKGAFR
jgi:hypothetical protein